MSRPARDIVERLDERKIIDENGCWIWSGPLAHGTGYGSLHWRGGPKLVHRVSYIVYKGEIESKMVIDHLCRNKLCFNPDHLESVTTKENILRGTSPAAINSKKEYCINGHNLEENAYTYDSKRLCRVCRKDAAKRFRDKSEFVDGKYKRIY